MSRAVAKAAPVAPTRFANISDAMLADELGRIDVETKALEESEKEAREEMTRRDKWAIEGETFVVTKSVAATTSIDSAAIRAEMGKEWVSARSKTSQRTTYRIGRKAAAAPVAPARKRATPARKRAPRPATKTDSAA